MSDTVTVREVMATDVWTLKPGDTVEAAADILAEKGVSTLPVVGADGTLVGVLRDDDLIASEARVHVPTFINFLGLGVPFPGEMKHLEAELKDSGATVADVMTTEPPTIGPDATLEDAATIMHDEGVNSIPVVDGNKKVLGIVARADLVRFIARTT